MDLNTPVYCLSIEPIDGKTFRHGFHLGTDLVVAKKIAAEKYHQRNEAAKTRATDLNGHCMWTRTVALFFGNKMVDVYDGQWSSEWSAQ